MNTARKKRRIFYLAMHEEVAHEYQGVPRIRLDSFSSTGFYNLCRFEKREFQELVLLLDFPPIIVCRDGHLKLHCSDALLIVLVRLAYPIKWEIAERVLNRVYSASQLSSIFVWTIDYLAQRWEKTIDCVSQCFTEEMLALYMERIQAAGGLVDNIVGFIDGTFVYTARPLIDQESLYNGWKKGHGLKFQAVSFPDGTIGSFFGPVPGRRQDEYLVSASEIKQYLRGVYTLTRAADFGFQTFLVVI